MKRFSTSRDSNEPIPDFDLPSTRGGARLKHSDFRQLANLVIIFIDDWSCDHCRRLLRALKEQRDLFTWLDARVLAVAMSPLAGLSEAGAELEPDISLLADEDGRVTDTFAAKGGGWEGPFLVITDRYGSLFSWMGLEEDEEIDFHEVESTLLFIATQCPECGRPGGDTVAM